MSEAPSTSTFGFRDVDAREKVQLVRGVFDSVADRYDVMNDLMSGGVHRLWKDMAANRLNPQPGELILDLAGGTGDMARRFSKMARKVQQRRGGPDARVMVIDYNAEMIAAGRKKGGEPEMTWNVGDAGTRGRAGVPDRALHRRTLRGGRLPDRGAADGVPGLAEPGLRGRVRGGAA